LSESKPSEQVQRQQPKLIHW